MADPPSIAERLHQLWAIVGRPDGREYATEEVARQIQAHGGSVTSVYIRQIRRGKQDNPTVQILRWLADVFFVSPAYFLTTDREAAEILAGLKELMAVWHTQVGQIAGRLDRLLAVVHPGGQASTLEEVARQIEAHGGAITAESLGALYGDVPAGRVLRQLDEWAKDPRPMLEVAQHFGVPVRYFAVSDSEAEYILKQLRALVTLREGNVIEMAARAGDLAAALDGLVELLQRSQAAGQPHQAAQHG